MSCQHAVTGQCFIFSDEDVLHNFSTLKLHKAAHKTLAERIMFLWRSTLNKGLWRSLHNLRPDFKHLKVIAQNWSWRFSPTSKYYCTWLLDICNLNYFSPRHNIKETQGQPHLFACPPPFLSALPRQFLQLLKVLMPSSHELLQAVVKTAYCSSKGPEFGFQHSHQAIHNHL